MKFLIAIVVIGSFELGCFVGHSAGVKNAKIMPPSIDDYKKWTVVYTKEPEGFKMRVIRGGPDVSHLDEFEQHVRREDLL